MPLVSADALLIQFDGQCRLLKTTTASDVELEWNDS